MRVVIVRSPSSPVVVEMGKVLTERCSITGHDDRVVRPTNDAVRLFWRFMIEKFGVDRRADPSETHRRLPHLFDHDQASRIVRCQSGRQPSCGFRQAGAKLCGASGCVTVWLHMIRDEMSKAA
jgi:hypothetical protein